MIVCLLGKAGVGKTSIAEAMEQYVPDSFIIDGDDLRAETSNTDIGIDGREKNMHLGYSRARWLSDLGFTVFVAMQAPIKEIREQYLTEDDIQVVITNNGSNPKDAAGYNKNFSADYTGIDCEYEFIYDEFNPTDFYRKIFPKVLVIARFQLMHRGHKIVLETAKRLSPDITVALRIDEGDEISLSDNIQTLKNMGYNVIKSPDLEEPPQIWENFVKKYDMVVQGNPDVIRKFQGSDSIDNILSKITLNGPTDIIFKNGVRLKYIPRIGHISATKLREAFKKGDIDYTKGYIASPDILRLAERNLDAKEIND